MLAMLYNAEIAQNCQGIQPQITLEFYQLVLVYHEF